MQRKPGNNWNESLQGLHRVAVWNVFSVLWWYACITSRHHLFPSFWDPHSSFSTVEREGASYETCDTVLYTVVFLLFCNPHYGIGVLFLLSWAYQSRNSQSVLGVLVVIPAGSKSVLPHLIQVCLSVLKNTDSSCKLTTRHFLNLMCLNLFCSIIRETSRTDALTNQWHNTDDFHFSAGINYFAITRVCSRVLVVPQVTVQPEKLSAKGCLLTNSSNHRTGMILGVFCHRWNFWFQSSLASIHNCRSGLLPV